MPGNQRSLKQSDRCHAVEFRTSLYRDAPSNGPFVVRDYGTLPASCSNTFGSSCTIQVCSANLHITAETENAWMFDVFVNGAHTLPTELCGVHYNVESHCGGADTTLESDASDTFHDVETWAWPTGARSYRAPTKTGQQSK